MSRDVGYASFNIYPAQVDLTEWTRKLEEKFEDLTKLVDRRFNALDSLVKGEGLFLVRKKTRLFPLNLQREHIFMIFNCPTRECE